VNGEEFTSLLEAQMLAKEWKRDYNYVRPHISLGYRTPAEFRERVPWSTPLRYTGPRSPV
jgi:transposase InsO family protein